MHRDERVAGLSAAIEGSLNRLETQLLSGHSEYFLEVLAFWGKFHRYSLHNSLLIRSQCPFATRVAGMRAWNALGYQVKKGAMAIWIRGPWLKKEVDPDTGEVWKRLVGYVPLMVFDASQVEPRPPESTYPLADDRDWATELALLKCRAGIAGMLVTDDPLPPEIHGLAAGRDRIYLNQRLSESEKVLTLLHELVHCLAHFDGAERTRQQCELEAEATCFVVCQALGIEHPFSRDYLLSYEIDLETFRESLERIGILTKRVLGVVVEEAA